VEREFFEMFCSVDGVGVRKALRAMVRPVRDVAALIADQDAKGLATLPGVGPSTAERIIAKLRRKMCKFALIAEREETTTDLVQHDVVEDTYQLLTQLGHSDSEARQLLEDALATQQKFKDVDALMHAVYQTQHAQSR
jgi:Holliday junction DNA helicase RuvA